MDYYQKFCPPFRSDENGKIECTIIPRQIQDAASRCGLKPLYGYTSFTGPSSVDGVPTILLDYEVQGESQYYVEGDGYESAEDMSIDEASNFPSDEEFEESMG